jgi:hypothetical protein
MTKSKRFWVTFSITLVLTGVGLYAFLEQPDKIGAFTGYIAAVIVPVVAYLAGETLKPSKKK